MSNDVSRQLPGQASPSDLFSWLHAGISLFCSGAHLSSVTQLLSREKVLRLLALVKASGVVDLAFPSWIVWSCCGQDAGFLHK